eukprot:scaffold41742_cov98-Phaeocystis_antarctica.AAC.1
MAVSGRHGTSTVGILDVFAADIKFTSLDATPPRAMKPTNPVRLHTAEFTFVTRRFARESFSKLRGLASMSNPIQLKHLSSANVFEYVIPSYAPSSTNTPRAPKPPAISTNDGSINNSSTCCELECCKAQCAARKAAPPIETREDGGVQSYCKIARACERFTAGHVLFKFPTGTSALAARGRRGLSRTGYQQRLLGLPTSCARPSRTEALPPARAACTH